MPQWSRAQTARPTRPGSTGTSTREQRRFGGAVHLTHELDRSREAGPPAARDNQTVAGPLRGFHRPVIALGTVQRPEEQIVLRRAPGKTPEDVVRGIEPVVDEDVAVVTTRMVAREKDAVGIRDR